MPANPPKIRWAVTAVLSAVVFCIGLSSSAVTPYRGIVAVDALHMSNAFYALVTSVSSIGIAVISLLLGYFADRISDRRLGVLACAAFAGVAYGLIFLAPSQLTYIVAFCVILPFGGALFSQTLSFSRVYFDRARADGADFRMSALRTLYSLAWVAAPAVVGWVATRFSIYGVFGVAAAAQLACILVFGSLFLVPEIRIGPASRQPSMTGPGERAVPPGRLVGIGGVVLLRVAIFLHLMTIPLVLTANFHGSLADVSLNAAICAGLEIPFMLGWGWLAGRFSQEAVMIAAALLYALYLGLVYFAHSVADILWLQGLNAIGTAALVSIPINYLQESIRGRVGLSTALFDAVTVVAQMLASGVFAVFATRTNYLPVMLAATAVSLCGAVAMAWSMLSIRSSRAEVADQIPATDDALGQP